MTPVIGLRERLIDVSSDWSDTWAVMALSWSHWPDLINSSTGLRCQRSIWVLKFNWSENLICLLVEMGWWEELGVWDEGWEMGDGGWEWQMTAVQNNTAVVRTGWLKGGGEKRGDWGDDGGSSSPRTWSESMSTVFMVKRRPQKLNRSSRLGPSRSITRTL